MSHTCIKRERFLQRLVLEGRSLTIATIICTCDEAIIALALADIDIECISGSRHQGQTLTLTLSFSS